MQAVAYYNSVVDYSGRALGRALRDIQGDLKNTVIARRALGDSATGQDIRDFANYYSRIAAGKVPNVGLQKLRLIAKGLEFLTLSSFFARIEGLPTAEPAGEDSSPQPIPQAVRGDEATLVPSARDYQEIIATLSHLLALARQGRDGLHRRQVADPGPPAARHARHRKKRDPRAATNRPKTRRPKN